MARIFNFAAGPSTLPVETLQEAAAKMVDFDNTGMSLIEMSHRGKVYEGVHTEPIDMIREVLQVPENDRMLPVQGGETLPFGIIRMAA